MERQALVSRYRDELKGIAILWVIFFHSQLALPGHWDLLRQLGYGGVDIFFFLMGMGLYRSLQKSDALAGYASRRLWRILPAYLPVLLLWMVIMYPTYGLSRTEAIRGVAGNLTMTGYWLQTPYVFNWFANGQFFFILIAPLFFALLSRAQKPKATLLVLLVLAVAIGLGCIAQKQLMGASRLPVFLLGMAFAMPRKSSEKHGWVRFGYGAAFLAGLAILLLCTLKYPELLYDYGMYWYPFALIIPGLSIGAAWVMQKVESKAALLKPLRFLGRCSFEVYLLNIWMVELAKKFAIEGISIWLLLCAGNLAAGIGYHMLVVKGTEMLQSRIRKPV